MPWMKWLPWRFFLRSAARAHGFLDPIAVLARLRSFAQPAEVGEPVELLRAGMIFHARGLINARVIQHNLDWIWPYWVEQQFDPTSDAFIPRAFSMTHINLSHRNWTAIGLPNVPALPLVDPRGLVTPHYDGWSLDAWVLTDAGVALFPSRSDCTTQRLLLDDDLTVETRSETKGCRLSSRAWVSVRDDRPCCQMQVSAESDAGGWLVLALRPCNPEGVSFIHRIAMDAERRHWHLDHGSVQLDRAADLVYSTDYHVGDISAFLRHRHRQLTSPQQRPTEQLQSQCSVGMATAAALYRIVPGSKCRVTASTPLDPQTDPAATSVAAGAPGRWTDETGCTLRIPDSQWQFLYEAAVRTLVLHSPGDVYPGPYTYKRFWFRDAAFMIHALLCAGLHQRAERSLDLFPGRQTRSGFFHSQEGEWDSNGEALWLFDQYQQITGRPLKAAWYRAVVKGGRWLMAKRLADGANHRTAGLLPAGFSAEHLGPPDNYYWDDFWGIAGLEAAARLCALAGNGTSLDRSANAEQDRKDFAAAALDLRRCLARSLTTVRDSTGRPAMPASPHRRLDAGAIGSLAAGYPLQLYAADDPALIDTASFLQESCFFRGGFFQDIIHSGINPYLTLHVAQVLLRAGDRRYQQLMQTVADLATATGQWPEAIHPRTGGGCMGDGQHAWAAAEWLLMLRNCLVREDGDRLILGSGVPYEWLVGSVNDAGTGTSRRTLIAFGPAPTRFGPVSLEIDSFDVAAGGQPMRWRAQWHSKPTSIDIQLPDFAPLRVDSDRGEVILKRHTKR